MIGGVDGFAVAGALCVACMMGGVEVVGDFAEAGEARVGVRGASMLARGVPEVDAAADTGGVDDLLLNNDENNPPAGFLSVGDIGSKRSSLGKIFHPVGTTASSLYSGRALTDASQARDPFDDPR